MSLIEKVEKVIQDDGINHGEIVKASPKMYSVQELDDKGDPCGAFLAVVMPNETIVGIYRLEKLINLDSD